MLCVVIKGPSFSAVCQQIKALPKETDLIELRLDYFESLDADDLRQIRALFPIPMIFTLRKRTQGGFFLGSEENRLREILRLIKLGPEYLDLESDVPLEFVEKIRRYYPRIKLIISYHDFKGTPTDLSAIYKKMKLHPAHHYKMAMKANNTLDALHLLHFKKSAGRDLNVMSMSYNEEPTRVLGPILDLPITYASLGETLTTAAGQLTAKSLLETYSFKQINPTTKIYGLIGDPVNKSISEHTHNALFRALGINAIYIKLPVKASELQDFLRLAAELGLSGLSVTRPLKEAILPFVLKRSEEVDRIGAVNTLQFAEEKVIGFNTDGVGALNAIERKRKVQGQTMIIVGTGGAGKAIAYEACRRGAHVTIVSRTQEKLEHLMKGLCIRAQTLQDLNRYTHPYDILINCTPHPMPIPIDHVHSQALIMDINTMPKDTELLKAAKDRGSQIIYGYEMFIEQALVQFNLWFENQIELTQARNILTKKAIEIL